MSPKAISRFHTPTRTARTQRRTIAIAGLRIHCTLAPTRPPPLPHGSKLLRQHTFQNPRVKSAYWQLPLVGRYRLFWSDAGTFDLDARGRKLFGYCSASVKSAAVEEVLRGPVCSFVLLEHGFEPLHASAVLMRRRCIAFAGPSGAGKSSLCAYLSSGARSRVADFFSDDVLPLCHRRGRVLARAGLAQMRLTPESARSLSMRRAAKSAAKSTFAVRGSVRGAHPLGGIYVLQRKAEWSAKVHCQLQSPAQAFVLLASLTANSSLTVPWRMENQLRTLGWVAANIPVRTLQYPSRFSVWPEIRKLIHSHLHER